MPDKKKRVVITGGTSGMGKETTKLFLKNGHDVVFTGIEPVQTGNKIAEELSLINKESKVFFFRCDVSSETEVKELVKFTNEKLGGCDILVNNAGIFEGGQAHETSVESWDRVFDVDVKGAFLTSKYFVPQMIERKYGAIVNTASISGLYADYNAVAYCAAKAAIANLSRAMALDYAEKGIRVNAVCPYATKTPMFMGGSTQDVIDAFNNASPMGRIANPEEIAEAIYFLASDKASFINGVNLPVDGGVTQHTGQPRQDKEE